MYGLPISPGAIPRLASVGRSLGPGSISVLLDDPEQLIALENFAALSGGVVPHAHIKIDMGGRRAGVIPGTDRFHEVVNAALAAHHKHFIVLSGLYSHAGHSYGGDSRVAAMKMLGEELGAMLGAADLVVAAAQVSVKSKTNGHSVNGNCTNGVNGHSTNGWHTNGQHSENGNGLHAVHLTDDAPNGVAPLPPLVLSAGASPTALAVQNLLAADVHLDGSNGNSNEGSELHEAAASLSALFSAIRNKSHVVEIHAGVYPTLDLQQLAAHSTSSDTLSWRDMAFTVLAEVHAVYPGRGANGRAEALVGAGGLALGRETCKAYSGMAMCSPWGRSGVELPSGEVEAFRGWMVGRFAQEHGILTWMEGETTGGQEPDALHVGQKLRLWPNHSCITGSHFGWYFVVDESRTGREDEIVDIWVRGRGW